MTVHKPMFVRMRELAEVWPQAADELRSAADRMEAQTVHYAFGTPEPSSEVIEEIGTHYTRACRIFYRAKIAYDYWTRMGSVLPCNTFQY